MSAVETKMPRPEAIEIAKAFVAELEGTHTELKVAGSLRRKLATVHDIEIVAVPKIGIEQVETVGLFGSQVERRDVDRLDERMAALLEAGTVQKRQKADGSWMGWGPKSKFVFYQGARIDVISAVNDWSKASPVAEPKRFGWLLLIWTGPAPFSRQLVVPRGKIPGEAKTITRTKDGRWGLLPVHIVPTDGWLTNRMSRERIPTPDEKTVFDLFGLPYREPWERT